MAMRDGKWKVLARLNGGSVRKIQNVTTTTLPLVRDAKLTDLQVYDMMADIGETTNLARARPKLAQELAAKRLGPLTGSLGIPGLGG